MNPIAFIIAILGVAFLFAYISNSLDERHSFLKLLLIGFALISLFIIPKVMVDFQPACDNVLIPVNSTNVIPYNGVVLNYGNGSTYVYDYVCSKQSNSQAIFEKVISYGYIVFILYFLIYLIYYYTRKFRELK